MTTFYGTVAGYRAYNAELGRDTATDTDDEVEALLLYASMYIDGRYEPSYWAPYTYRTGRRAQDRAWPRESFVEYYGSVIPNNVVPIEIEQATYEAAYFQASGAGQLITNFTPNKYRRAAVDGAVSVEYNLNIMQAADAQVTIPLVESLLWAFLYPRDGGGNMSGLSGKVYRV